MKKQNKKNNDEIELLSSFERGEWKSVKNIKKEKAHAKKTAANTIRIKEA